MVLGIILSWSLIYILGYLISLITIKRTSFSFRLISSFGFGTGFIALLMSVLGMLYNFEFSTFISTYIILISALLYLNRGSIRLPKKLLKIPKLKIDYGLSYEPIKIIPVLTSLVVLIFLVSSFLHISYFPDLYEDAPIYAQWSKLMYNDKKINFVEGGPTIGLGFASNYPSAHQVLSAFVHFFTGESMEPIRLTSLLVALLLTLLVYIWSKEIFKGFGNRSLPFYSVLIFLSLPFIIFFSRSSSHYIYFLFQFSIACYFLHKFILEKDSRNLYLSGIFGGFAASVSYIGLSFLLILPLALLAERRFYRGLIVAFVLFALVSSPWYLKNLIVLDNPLWPFGGGKYIDPKIQENSVRQLNAMSKVSGFNYDTVEDLKNSLQRLLFSYINPSNASYYHGLNPFFILLAIPGILFWLRTKLTNLNMGFFVFWFLIALAFYIVTSSYWNRYLITLSIPTVFLSVYVINHLFEKSQGFGHSLKSFMKLVLVFFLGFFFVYAIYLSLFWDECRAGEIEQVLENLGDYQKILEICYGGDFELWTWVNGNLPENATVATTDFLKLYYYNRTVIEFNSWKLRDMQYSTSIGESARILKDNGIEYLAITGELEEFKNYPQYFKVVKEIDGKAVYKVG